MVFSASFTKIIAFSEAISTRTKVSQLYLAGSNQVGQREHQMPFDRAFQVTRAVTRVGSFLQQELLHSRRAIEDELVGAGGHEHALLYHAEFDFKNLRQMLIPQSLEYDSFIDAVHELGRELTPSRFHGRALNFVVEIVVDFHCPRGEPKPAIHQIRHLAGAQVRGQNDDALRKIDAAIIAERERGFVENAEQQLPERV